VRTRLFHIDAFTKQPFRGNPAAVCLLDSWLDDSLLRRVAAENNLSATAFMVTGEDGYDLRWFTPRCEVELCGHATLAAAHLLINVRNSQLDCVTFRTRFRGLLSVRKSGGFLIMDFPAMPPKPSANVLADLTKALRLDSRPTQILEANNTYIVVFDSPDVIENLRPNFAMLEDLHPFVVAVTAPGTDTDLVSRYFAPSYGIPEDPVTGSAHCLLTPYWAGRFGKTKLRARQLSQRGGELWCEMNGDRVRLAGTAVVTMEGFLSI